MLKDLATLVIPIHVHLFFQECIKIPVNAGKAFGNHSLSTALLNTFHEFLIIRVEAFGLLEGAGYRCLSIERFQIA
jgi:hypothetical protein